MRKDMLALHCSFFIRDFKEYLRLKYPVTMFFVDNFLCLLIISLLALFIPALSKIAIIFALFLVSFFSCNWYFFPVFIQTSIIPHYLKVDNNEERSEIIEILDAESLTVLDVNRDELMDRKIEIYVVYFVFDKKHYKHYPDLQTFPKNHFHSKYVNLIAVGNLEKKSKPVYIQI